MDIIIAILFALAGVFLVLFKRNSNSTQAKLEQTKTEDASLKVTQEEAETAIKDIDAGIEKAKQEREAKRLADQNLTLKEIADQMRKGLK